jgi:hypothetical protein
VPEAEAQPSLLIHLGTEDRRFTGNQALSLILVGQVSLPVFKDRGIDNVVLTRSLEDSGTLAAPLVPGGPPAGCAPSSTGALPSIPLPQPFRLFDAETGA